MGFVTNSQLKGVMGALVDNLENGVLTPSQAIAAKSISPVSEESGTIHAAPFISQGTGTNNNTDSVDTSPVAQQLEKFGNTVPVMQLISPSVLPSTQTINGITLTNNNDGTVTLNGTATDLALFPFISSIITGGHKYMLLGGNTETLGYGFNTYSPEMWHESAGINAPKCVTAYTNGNPGDGWRIVVRQGTTVNNAKVRPCVFDVTGWNSDIITDLTANPSHFSWYYNGSMAYNAGSLEDCNGRYLVNTKRNLFGGVMERGAYSGSTGEPTAYNPGARCNDYILVVPSVKYYLFKGNFVAPSGTTLNYNLYQYDANKAFISKLENTTGIFELASNCQYVKFAFIHSGSTSTVLPIPSEPNVTFSLYYTPEQGGEGYDQYYPYVEPKVYDTGTETLKSAMNAHDVKLPDGTITRNIGSYTFTGNETWSDYGSSGEKVSSISSISAKSIDEWTIPNVVCPILSAVNRNNAYYGNASGICVNGSAVYVNSNQVSNLTGKTIYFELATPTTEQGTPFAENIEIDDYGMMYWLDTENNLVSVPQGCKIFYPADYVLWLDTANARTGGDANKIALTDVTDALMDSIAPGYVSTKEYKVGNLFTDGGVQYYCKKNAPAGTLPTNTEYFEEKSIAEIIDAIKTGEITVGKATLADNFDSNMVLTDNSGYLYRTTGGSLEVGEQNRVKKIVGASVPIIQLASFEAGKIPSALDGITYSTDNNKSVTLNGTATVTSTRSGWFNLDENSLVKGHIYLVVSRKISGTATAPAGLYFPGSNVVNIGTPFIYKIPADTISLARGSIYYTNGTVFTNYKIYFYCIDITATFGTTVANRLYALETAQAGTGIAKAKEILVKDYYPYNVTDFTHTKTSGKVNNGFNQFNLPAMLTAIGDPINAVTCRHLSNQIIFDNRELHYQGRVCVYKNGFVVNSGSVVVQYMYTDGTNSYGNAIHINGYNISASDKVVSYIRLVYSNDGSYNCTNAQMCVSLAWDGERNGEYEDYQEWNYPVQDVELKGILSLDAQDNWVSDGDEYLPSGSVSGRFDIKNLGQMTWTKVGNKFGTDSFNGALKIYTTKLLCTNGYKVASPGYSGTVLNDMEMCSHNSSSNTMYIRDDRYETVEAFQSAMNNVYLLFAVQTPTESSAAPYTELQTGSNWGTEKWIDTRDVPMPVFSTCEYIPDLKAKEEVAPESPSEDGVYIMSRQNGINTYSPLVTWLDDQGYADTPMTEAEYDEVIDALEGN